MRHYRKSFLHKSLILTIISLVILCFVTTAKAANKNNNVDRVFACTSIEIEENDTLWDIASRYYTNEYKSVSAYVKEIKKANNLQSDEIHAGNYIIVPYYAE